MSDTPGPTPAYSFRRNRKTGAELTAPQKALTTTRRSPKEVAEAKTAAAAEKEKVAEDKDAVDQLVQSRAKVRARRAEAEANADHPPPIGAARVDARQQAKKAVKKGAVY